MKYPADYTDTSVCKEVSRTMDRWHNKVAIVTGASSGIGAATAKTLVNHGVKVVGMARLDRLQELTVTLGKGKFYPIQCDIRKEEDILKVFQFVETELGGADILINNAGVGSLMPIIDSPTEEYLKILETNLLGPTICAREFSQSIRKRNVPGHIININSMAGLYAEAIEIPIGLYSASKYALRTLGTELRHEMMQAKLPIKITNISRGMVLTEILSGSVEWENQLKKLNPLQNKDLADAVVYVLGTPDLVEIHEVTVTSRMEQSLLQKNQ
ncbi:farnesol dehydrogenase-like [Andrena cerasifolii]|uniref:farnesol dehydrogenase-like n=1 Tax=Andrena cerasifolii TaxID=2819439 RepID=UPI00403776C9